MKFNDRTLEELIGKTNYFSDDEPERNEKFRGALKNIFGNLIERNNAVLDEIKAHAIRPNNHSTRLNVVTALISPNDAQSIFYEFAPILDANADIIFIDLDYEQMRELVGDVGDRIIFNGTFEVGGTAKNFRYTLEFDRSLLSREEILLRAFEIYRVAEPLIFSPFARKSFRVKILDELPADADHIDYCFADNGIPALTDEILCNNFELTTTAELMPEMQKPFGDFVMHKYSFERNDDRIELYVPCDDKALILELRAEDDRLNMWLDRETQRFYNLTYKKVEPSRKEIAALELNGKLHFSDVARNKFSPQRILTRLDLEYAIRPFRDWNGMHCRLVEHHELNKLTPRYMSKYSRRGSKHLTVRPLRRACIKFEGADRKKFPSDCINHALGWLQYHYPEVEWIGGV